MRLRVAAPRTVFIPGAVEAEQQSVRAPSNQLAVVIVLAVIFPVALGTKIVVATRRQSPVPATWAAVGLNSLRRVNTPQ